MKKIISLILLLLFFNLSVNAVEFDSSIDSQIRETYNIDEPNLPPIPQYEGGSEYFVPNKQTVYNPLGKTFVLKSGTIINLKSVQNITDQHPKGYKVSFITTGNIITKEGQSIPAGTVLKGTIINSHGPQISANGGLVELLINEIYFNGIKSEIETKISNTNNKKIFYGNIKGKHSYWNNFSKVMTPGKKSYNASRSCASLMASIPAVNTLSFIPLIGGSAIYAINFCFAPFITIFTKGKSLNLPSGTSFQIKTTKEVQIKG